MTINYTTLLGLAKPVTGTEAGSWGEIVNNEITTLLEDAVAATVEVDVTAGGVTLTDIDGQQDQARCAIVKVIGTPGVARDVVAPNRSKTYVVINLSNAAVTLKASGTSGVSIPTSTRSLVVWDGTNYVLVASSTITGGVTSVTATSPITSTGGTTPTIALSTVGTSFGGTNITAYTTGDILYASATNTLSRRAIGSNGDVLTVAGGIPVWQSPTGGGGGGTVVSVGFSSPSNSVFPVSGSPVTTSGTLTMGYTGTAGSLLYASANNTISNLPVGQTGQVLVVNSSVLPSWGSVGVAGGGTGFSSYSAGQLLVGNSSGTLSRLNPGSNGLALTLSSGLPTWGSIGVAGGGTGLTSYAAGDLIVAASDSALGRRTIGSAGQVLTVVSGFPQWATPTSSGGSLTSFSYGFPNPIAISVNAGSDYTFPSFNVNKTGTMVIHLTVWLYNRSTADTREGQVWAFVNGDPVYVAYPIFRLNNSASNSNFYPATVGGVSYTSGCFAGYAAQYISSVTNGSPVSIQLRFVPNGTNSTLWATSAMYTAVIY